MFNHLKKRFIDNNIKLQTKYYFCANYFSKLFFSPPSIYISDFLIRFGFSIMFCLWFRRLSGVMLCCSSSWREILISHLIVMFVQFRSVDFLSLMFITNSNNDFDLFNITKHETWYSERRCEFIIIYFFLF